MKKKQNDDLLMTKKILREVLIKPAGPDCNLACDYCFYLEKSSLFSQTRVHRMSEEILEAVIRQMMEQTDEMVAFNWQGGEPTLMGIPFFQKAVDFQKKYGRNHQVGNGFQTNGILIDDHWAKFFAEYNFLIGLSVDGPQHIHDQYRKTVGGSGSWQKVVDTAKRLLNAGVEVNALTVVNNYSVKFPEEIFKFLREIGLNYMQFIPCIERDPFHPNKLASFSVSAEDYGHFLCKIFDLWLDSFYNGVQTTSVRFFESLLFTYVNISPPECTLMEECGNYLVIEHNGDVYSCDFFVEPEWKLGNILADQLTDLLNSPKQDAFGKIKAKLPQMCVNCKWLNQCRGGCVKDRLRNPINQNNNYFCQSYKIFLQYTNDRFIKLAKEWEKNQQEQRQQIKNSILEAVAKGRINIKRNDPCPCGSGKKFKKCCGAEI